MRGAREKLIFQGHIEIAETAHRAIALGVKPLVLFIELYPEPGRDAFGKGRVERRGLNSRPSRGIVHGQPVIEQGELIGYKGVVDNKGRGKEPLSRDPVSQGSLLQQQEKNTKEGTCRKKNSLAAIVSVDREGIVWRIGHFFGTFPQ